MLELAKHNSDDTAIVNDEVSWTYGELNRRALRIARNLLTAGLESGDRVVTLLPNCPELVALYVAGFHAGFTIVPLDTRYHSALINFALRHSGARAVVVDGGRIADMDKCDAMSDVEFRMFTGKGKHEGYQAFRHLLATRPTESLQSNQRGDDVSLVTRIIEDDDAVAFHRRLQCADRIDLGNPDGRTESA